MTAPHDEPGPAPEIPSIDLRRVQHEQDVVLEVAGEIDLSNATQLHAAFAHVLRDEPAFLVVDLSRVTFLGSAGLNLLIATNDRMGEGRMRVVAPSTPARRAIELSGMDQVLSVYTTVDDALSAS